MGCEEEVATGSWVVRGRGRIGEAVHKCRSKRCHGL